jgi:F-type H+-transporting ATPase subunit a
MDVMRLKDISPDTVVWWQWGWASLNATIVFTWLVMGLLVVFAWLGTRRLTSETRFSRWQNLLEVLIDGMCGQIAEISQDNPRRYLPFVGTLFLFIVVSNLLAMFPVYVPPTGSLSTAAALAILVFLAVPVYGIIDQGVGGYLRHYIQPTPLMLPFHIIGELSRTLALAVRLFGNIMSGTKITAILLVVIPLFFPVLMQALGLLTGLIQAYIFAVLAMVYIASGTQARQQRAAKFTGTADPRKAPDQES